MGKIEQIAGELYTAYCEAVGGVAFNGDPLPSWSTFRADPKKGKQSDAWIAAACKSVSVFTRSHVLWGAGEPDCPSELKSSNGELHTLQCKTCGARGRMTTYCIPEC